MIISIAIKDPPEGYDTPKRGPLYLPICDSTLILIGECWIRAVEEINQGGDYWIYANKKPANKPLNPTAKTAG